MSPEFLLGIRPISADETRQYYEKAWGAGKQKLPWERDYEIADYYKVLGIDNNTTKKEILAAYRKKMREVHPDIHGESEENRKRSQEINAAFNALYKKPVQRRHE